MTKNSKPPKDFRPAQVVIPPSGRRFGKWKSERKAFDIYVTDIEAAEETLAITVYAATQREAIEIARKRLKISPLMRKIMHAAFTAVEIKD